MKHDLLFLAHNRYEFTVASIAALTANTDWSQVDRLIKYVDVDAQGHDDGTQNLVVEWHPEGPTSYTRVGQHGGPVNVMLKYLEEFGGDAEWFAKIDNDVIVPPGWWGTGAEVMAGFPALDLLGIEPPASRTPAPWASGSRECPPESIMALAGLGLRLPSPAHCDAIGGIGFMRTRAFLHERRRSMAQHSTYGGFTDWQLHYSRTARCVDARERTWLPLNVGWIVPPLKLFLLDRLTFEPWVSLSKEYISRGWQRQWTPYPAISGPELWDWWYSIPAREAR